MTIKWLSCQGASPYRSSYMQLANKKKAATRPGSILSIVILKFFLLKWVPYFFIKSHFSHKLKICQLLSFLDTLSPFWSQTLLTPEIWLIICQFSTYWQKQIKSRTGDAIRGLKSLNLSGTYHRESSILSNKCSRWAIRSIYLILFNRYGHQAWDIIITLYKQQPIGSTYKISLSL